MSDNHFNIAGIWLSSVSSTQIKNLNCTFVVKTDTKKKIKDQPVNCKSKWLSANISFKNQISYVFSLPNCGILWLFDYKQHVSSYKNKITNRTQCHESALVPGQKNIRYFIG